MKNISMKIECYFILWSKVGIKVGKFVLVTWSGLDTLHKAAKPDSTMDVVWEARRGQEKHLGTTGVEDSQSY